MHTLHNLLHTVTIPTRPACFYPGNRNSDFQLTSTTGKPAACIRFIIGQATFARSTMLASGQRVFFSLFSNNMKVKDSWCQSQDRWVLPLCWGRAQETADTQRKQQGKERDKYKVFKVFEYITQILQNPEIKYVLPQHLRSHVPPMQHIWLSDFKLVFHSHVSFGLSFCII